MFSWGSFFALIGIVGSAISIFEFIRLKLSHRSAVRPKQLALVCGGVFVALLIGSIIFSPILSQAGGNGRQTTTNQQSGTGSTPTQGQQTFSSTPSPTPTPVPPTPTPTPQPGPGTVLCQADASHGWNGWNGTPDWKVLNGILISDGTNSLSEGPPTIVAPCQLGGRANYAVEATIQVLNNNYPTCFGINVRGTPTSTVNGWQGYIGAVYVACNWGDNVLAFNADNANYGNLTSAPFSPGTSYHTYRVEAQDNQLRFLIDGAQILTVTSNTYTSGEQVGLWSYDAQLNVSSFKIIAL